MNKKTKVLFIIDYLLPHGKLRVGHQKLLSLSMLGAEEYHKQAVELEKIVDKELGKKTINKIRGLFK